MGKLLVGIIFLTLISLLFYVGSKVPSENKAKKEEEEKEKKRCQKEIQDIEKLEARLRLKILKLKQDAAQGKEEALKELEDLEEDLKMASELKNKYK